MKTAPIRLPTSVASAAHQNGCLNTVVASDPVTIVSIMMFDPNQIVNRSFALPWRSVSGIGWMVLSSR